MNNDRTNHSPQWVPLHQTEIRAQGSPSKKTSLPAHLWREFAIEDAEEAIKEHRATPVFKCPCCQTRFLHSYGIWSRTRWPREHELHCKDCVESLGLEREKPVIKARKPTKTCANANR